MEQIQYFIKESDSDIYSEPLSELYKKYINWFSNLERGRKLLYKNIDYSIFSFYLKNLNPEEKIPISILSKKTEQKLETSKEKLIETKKRGRPKKNKEEIIKPEIINKLEKIIISESLSEEIIHLSHPNNFIFNEEAVFKQIEDYTSSLANYNSTDYSLIISGDPGMGKTVTVKNKLIELLGKESNQRIFLDNDDDYKSLSDEKVEIVEEEIEELQWIEGPTKLTPQSIYITLYRENGKIILFDDADSVWEDETGINILKKVLDSKKIRKVGYGQKPILLKKASYTGLDVRIPSVFEFTGRCIFITNKYFKELNSALLSRSLVVEVDLSTEESLKRVKRLLPDLMNEDQNITTEIKENVLNYLLSISHLFKKIDLRTIESGIKEYFRSPDHWKERLRKSIELKQK